MTPQEHIYQAEQQLERFAEQWDDGEREAAGLELQAGILHALIAIAVESGVPHQSAPPVVS